MTDLNEAKHADLEPGQIGQYLLSEKAYLVLKWLGLLVLPTMAWVYSTVASAWDLPYIVQITTTLNVIGTAVAVIIGASQVHAKGALE